MRAALRGRGAARVEQVERLEGGHRVRWMCLGHGVRNARRQHNGARVASEEGWIVTAAAVQRVHIKIVRALDAAGERYDVDV